MEEARRETMPEPVAGGRSDWSGGRVADQERLVEKARTVDVEAAVDHGFRRILDGGEEGGHEIGRGQRGEVRREALVRDHLDLHVHDQADQAVAAHGQREEVRVLGAGRGDERPVGHDHADRADGGSHGAVGDGPAMGADGEGRGDAEIVVRLHDGGAVAQGVERGDDVGPARAAVDAVGAGGRVGLDPGVVHGDGGAVPGDGLPAHGMARGADVHGASVGAGGGELGPERLDQWVAVQRGADMGVDRRGGKLARVVEDEVARVGSSEGGHALELGEAGCPAATGGVARGRATEEERGAPCHLAQISQVRSPSLSAPPARHGYDDFGRASRSVGWAELR
jgi:hypothetical protein